MAAPWGAVDAATRDMKSPTDKIELGIKALRDFGSCDQATVMDSSPGITITTWTEGHAETADTLLQMFDVVAQLMEHLNAIALRCAGLTSHAESVETPN